MIPKLFSGLLIYILAWVSGYCLTLFIGAGLSAVSGYAILVGWWCAAYCSATFNIKPVVSIFAAGIFFILFLFVKYFSKDWFYHDIASLTYYKAAFIALIQCFFVASPVIADAGFRKVISIFSKNI